MRSAGAEEDRMTPKETAISFLKMAGSGNVREAFEKFVAR